MYMINDYLTREERLDAIRLGAIRKLAALGMTPSSFSREMEKRAVLGINTTKDAVTGTGELIGAALKLCLYAGIPLGAMTYILQSSLAPKKKQNRELKMKLDEYNEISDRFRAGLS